MLLKCIFIYVLKGLLSFTQSVKSCVQNTVCLVLADVYFPLCSLIHPLVKCLLLGHCWVTEFLSIISRVFTRAETMI